MRHLRIFLIKSLIKITGHMRYMPDNEWDNRIWSANIFRAWEYLFGRKVGIRKEACTWSEIKDGRYIIHRKFYTLEALLSYYEGSIREFLSFRWFSILNYQLGAIALDVASNGTTTSSSPLTFSHTCTGSNLALAVGVGVFDATPSISTPTYNSINMSIAGSQTTNGTHEAAMYYTLGPSTGSNTVSVAFGSSAPDCNAVATSYTGVLQTGIDSYALYGTSGASGGPNPNWNTTANNCWAACVLVALNVFGGGETTRGGVLQLNSTGPQDMEFQDTNGPITPAGNITFPWGYQSGNTWAAMGVAFAPVTFTWSELTNNEYPKEYEDKVEVIAY